MKVLCKLPNASGNINGVEFVDHPAGKISVDVTDDVAQQFLGIQGYEVAEDRAPSTPAWELALSDEDRERLADLRKRGAALNIPNAEKMGLKRLSEEVAAAEKAATNAS